MKRLVALVLLLCLLPLSYPMNMRTARLNTCWIM